MLKVAYQFCYPGTDSKKHRAMIETPNLSLKIVGAKDFDDAANVAKSHVEDNIQIIELCGGHGPTGGMRVIEAVGGKIPVGLALYWTEQMEKFRPLMSVAMLKAAYLFVCPGTDSKKHRVTIETPNLSLKIVGAKDFDDAANVAKSLAEDGTQLIEVGRGHGPVGAARVIEAVGGKALVGPVFYGWEEMEKVSALVNK